METTENASFYESSEEQSEVTYFYDKNTWKIGETYRMRVSHIFDISKFWIVLLEQELTLFQRFIYKFYMENREQYKMLPEQLQSKMYCVAFTEGGFYRGMIVDIPLLKENVQGATVFLIDFGQVIPVIFEDIYYLDEKFYQVPRFAVRASLSQIQPCDGTDWSAKAIQRFNELIYEKVLLCILENTDPINKIVYITITDVDQNSQVHDIGDILINENLAIPITAKNRKRRKNKRWISLHKYPFIFPTFEAIEQSEVPPNAKVFDLLRQSRTSFSLLDPYYNFSEIFQ